MDSPRNSQGESSQAARLRVAGSGGQGPGTASGHVTQLPLTRVKLIIKTDPDIALASQEAVLMITKATELFISHLSRQAYQFTVKGKRKTLQRRDIDACLPIHDELAFLEGALDTW